MISWKDCSWCGGRGIDREHPDPGGPSEPCPTCLAHAAAVKAAVEAAKAETYRHARALIACGGCGGDGCNACYDGISSNALWILAEQANEAVIRARGGSHAE